MGNATCRNRRRWLAARTPSRTSHRPNLRQPEGPTFDHRRSSPVRHALQHPTQHQSTPPNLPPQHPKLQLHQPNRLNAGLIPTPQPRNPQLHHLRRGRLPPPSQL
uniref:(northern house mosquito) hypothetical protein n=1 Tax=Culex pipiens TaxID=7175 RepID=A0A8D8N0D5_CULPI